VAVSAVTHCRCEVPCMRWWFSVTFTSRRHSHRRNSSQSVRRVHGQRPVDASCCSAPSLSTISQPELSLCGASLPTQHVRQSGVPLHQPIPDSFELAARWT